MKKKRLKVKVRTAEARTSSGSIIRVAVVEPGELDAGSVYLTFTSAKGKITRLGLGREAMDALHKLWLGRLEWESAQGRFTYAIATYVKRILPLVPWAWAGIPPVEGPYEVRAVMQDGRWSVPGSAGIPPQENP